MLTGTSKFPRVVLFGCSLCLSPGPPSPSHLIERPGAVGEFVSLDPETLKHGDKEIRQGDVLVSDLFLPGFTAAIPRTAGWIVAGIVEVLAVLESHVFPAG